MEPQDFSFSKRQRLCGKKEVDALFTDGESFFAYPFRVIYLVEVPEENGIGQVADNKIGGGVQVLISVGKKRHKRAVVRNLLKRRTREAFRHHARPLKEIKGKTIHLALLYSSKDVLDYGDIEHGVKKAIATLGQALGL
ncbi:MAG: ribonuclease P protein component [Rikenellaceae bacterium]|nr:ribonuclease P protein component [Rikenellaceae bacterium]